MHRMKGEESVGGWAVGGYATEGLGRVWCGDGSWIWAGSFRNCEILELGLYGQVMVGLGF